MPGGGGGGDLRGGRAGRRVVKILYYIQIIYAYAEVGATGGGDRSRVSSPPPTRPNFNQAEGQPGAGHAWGSEEHDLQSHFLPSSSSLPDVSDVATSRMLDHSPSILTPPSRSLPCCPPSPPSPPHPPPRPTPPHPAPPHPITFRNRPCPCGSLRKYKACCESRDRSKDKGGKGDAASSGQQASGMSSATAAPSLRTVLF